jgi:predicted ATP-grasp superfamily ATP-dependent carboligase
MRIFLYEYVTGGGLFTLSPGEPPAGSLLAEGQAMFSALACDFAALPACSISTLHDARLPRSAEVMHVPCRRLTSRAEAEKSFSACLDGCDAVLLIAPESDRILEQLARQVEASGKLLLSPSSEFIAAAADKWRTYERLLAAGVPSPRTWCSDDSLSLASLPCPLVVKPRDGCGSGGVQWFAEHRLAAVALGGQSHMLVQEFCPGMPASVAWLCGPNGAYPFPATQQHLSDDGRFTYLGGECPLPPKLNKRAQVLGRRALQAMPAARGYVGIDLVLGEAADGSRDYVIEINPRYTTSYVGLRALARSNLAEAMLHVVGGREPQLTWRAGRVVFSAEGAVEHFQA